MTKPSYRSLTRDEATELLDLVEEMQDYASSSRKGPIALGDQTIAYSIIVRFGPLFDAIREKAAK